MSTVDAASAYSPRKATAAPDNGRVIRFTQLMAFRFPPAPHDSWVFSDEPYVTLPFRGAENYVTNAVKMANAPLVAHAPG